jgi:hypothetical protein
MNAKEEFLKAISSFKAEILCAQIRHEYSYDDNTVFTLNLNYTEEELKEFLNNLDFEYNSGFGRQYLFGTIWCKNNSWFTRHEYDGSECWEYHYYPKFPERKPAVENFSSNWYEGTNE